MILGNSSASVRHGRCQRCLQIWVIVRRRSIMLWALTRSCSRVAGSLFDEYFLALVPRGGCITATIQDACQGGREVHTRGWIFLLRRL